MTQAQAQILDGKKIAREIEAKLENEINNLHTQTNQVPSLVSIIVGNNKQSHKFVDLKEQAAHRVGIRFEKKSYPESFDPRLIIDFIREKNANPDVHGIMVQLPLPSHFNQVQILKSIHPFKDVDALHPKNMGLLMMGSPTLTSPVIQAVTTAIEAVQNPKPQLQLGPPATLYNPDLTGKNIVIVGGGLLVGKPLSIYLMSLEATVTVANKYTQDLTTVTRSADIVISATGVNNLITSDYIRNDAVVIDAARDVSLPSVCAKAAAVSPSPGGVGPLTIAYLLHNTVLAFKQSVLS